MGRQIVGLAAVLFLVGLATGSCTTQEPPTWHKAGATEQETRFALGACRLWARTDDARESLENSGLRVHGSENKFNTLVEVCMYTQGYVVVEGEAAPDG